MERIYLDNSATTKLDSTVEKAMIEAHKYYGNPSSIHTFGQESRNLLDNSRDTIANFLNCSPMEVIFTSGGSESDNLAIKGIVDSYKLKVKSQDKPHIITSAVEHHAVLHTVQDLEKQGIVEATYIQPRANGIVKVEDIKAAIRSNTVLVSIMYVNNEIGTIQPIREIGKLIEKTNEVRVKQLAANQFNKIYFHTDAVQAVEFCPMDVDYLHVDLLTATAHKIHGPKGVGLLYIRKETPVSPQITGGEQEFGKRAGTENVTGIAGFSKAIAEATRNESEKTKVEILRDKLENFILKNISYTRRNGDKELRVPHILNISFKNAEGEAIILNLDFLGIAVSSGSACTARALEPSHVLTAIGVQPEWSHGAIRFSLSRYTTEREIDKVCEVLPEIIKKLREMSPF